MVDEKSDQQRKEGKREDRCNNIRFFDLCRLFEEISTTSGPYKKVNKLLSPKLKVFVKGQSIFPLIRLVLPANDAERGRYGMKQKKIAMTYVNGLSLDKNCECARRLLNWKDPTKNQGIIENANGVTGDFGTVLEDVLKNRVQGEASRKTLGEVNELLDQLAKADTMEDKTSILRMRILNFFRHMEQKWLIRIILQDLKLGLGHDSVLNAFYPNARRRYDECTNLRTVCEEAGLSSSLVGIQLFVHFSPMLAKGYSKSPAGQVSAVESAMNDISSGKKLALPIIMDEKLDGERILIHIGEDDTFVMFTRKGSDYTDIYWPLAHSIIRQIRKATSANRGNEANLSVILDGEILVMDAATKRAFPLGLNMSVAKIEREYGKDFGHEEGEWHRDLPAWMCFIGFDLLYLDGPGAADILAQSLAANRYPDHQVHTGEIASLPLVVRRHSLKMILPEDPYRVCIVPHRTVLSSDVLTRKMEIEGFFNEVTAAGGEGLVLKSLLSPYELGGKSRALAYWVKMKPEYGEHTDDLDLLILAAYYGDARGIRGEGVSTFLLGVKDDRDDEGYYTVTKVGTGYKHSDLIDIRQRLDEYAIPFDASNPPVHLLNWQAASTKGSTSQSQSQCVDSSFNANGSGRKMGRSENSVRPHVYYPPERSIVLQVKCAELVESNSFTSELTCRFPRVEKIHLDKDYRDIVSLSDLQALQNRPRNLTNETQTSAMDDNGAKGHVQKRKVAPKIERSIVDALHCIGSNLSGKKKQRPTPEDDVDTKSIFQKCKFCPIGSEFTQVNAVGQHNTVVKNYSRSEVIDLIQDHGGEVSANPIPPSDNIHSMIIAGNKINKQIRNQMEFGVDDIVDFAYLMDSIEADYRLPLTGVYLISASPATTLKLLKDNYDLLGCSMMEAEDEGMLRKVVDRLPDTMSLFAKRAVVNNVIAPKKRKSQAVATAVNQKEGEVKAAVVNPKLYQPFLSDWQKMQSLSWRESMALLSYEERQPLYMDCNCLYQEGVIGYFDLFREDFGEVDAAFVTDNTILSRTWEELYDNNKRREKVQYSQLEIITLQVAFERFVLRGGQVTSHFHHGVSHVIMHPAHPERLHPLQTRIREMRLLEPLRSKDNSNATYSYRSVEKRVVKPEWIDSCCEAKQIMESNSAQAILNPSWLSVRFFNAWCRLNTIEKR